MLSLGLRLPELPHDIEVFTYRRGPAAIGIGCHLKTPKRWLALSNRFGEKHGYSPAQIAKVRRIIKAIQELQDAIK